MGTVDDLGPMPSPSKKLRDEKLVVSALRLQLSSLPHSELTEPRTVLASLRQSPATGNRRRQVSWCARLMTMARKDRLTCPRQVREEMRQVRKVTRLRPSNLFNGAVSQTLNSAQQM